jgi:hypothetical protein
MDLTTGPPTQHGEHRRCLAQPSGCLLEQAGFAFPLMFLTFFYFFISPDSGHLNLVHKFKIHTTPKLKIPNLKCSKIKTF